MLQSAELDKDGFEEILQRAVGKIPQLYPEWTDFNPSDPGITLLEMMSYFTEVSEYHLNVIDDRNYRKYLKLLGRDLRGRVPAKTWLKVIGNGRLPANSRFYAENLSFETEYGIDVSENEIVSIQNGEEIIENKNNLFSDLHSKFSFSPFENKDEDGKYAFTVKLKKSLSAGNVVGVYVQIKEWENTSPFEDGFRDYVKYHCELSDNEWKRNIEVLRDETRGFCKSGIIVLKVTDKVSVGEGRKIRFLIDEGEYPIKPVITGILWNVVSARQVESHMDIVDLGMTYGICDTHVKFEVKDCIPESIRLFIIERNGKFEWECVKDFDNSDSLSRHFVYDEKNGEIIFGDGVQGRPPKGRVQIERYETSAGEAGNIKESALSGTDRWQAFNILPAVGGRNPQSIDECFKEFNMEAVPKRCVTLSDYETAVRNAPGIPIHRVKAFRNENKANTICIAIEAAGESRELNKSCIKNLRQFITPKALIGTNLEFVKPQYTRIYVFLEISVHPYYESCEKKTVEAVRDYFDSGEITFGDTIRGNQVISYLYGLPWIKGIRSLELSSSGNRGKSGNGRDVKLKEDCLPYVDSVTVHIVG
jgi:hypothetical protein